MVEETHLKLIHSSCNESQREPPTEDSPLLDNQTILHHESRKHSSPALSPPSRKIWSYAVICILFTELCERLTFYGILGNLVLFAAGENQLNYVLSHATMISSVFLGSCYLFPMVGGWLADSVAGKFSVILFSGIVYLIGAILIPLGSFDDSVSWGGEFLVKDKTFKRVVYICGLFLVAIGTGGIKSNVSPFGAEQVSNNGPEAIQTFFIWFYWFINIGALIGCTFVAYVQQFISYFYGYLIPACTLVISLIIFLAGKKSYITHPPTGSILSATLKIVIEAVKKSRRPSLSGECIDHWLDRAKMCNGGSYSNRKVDDVKKIFRLIPILATFILFWTIYVQTGISTILQGKYMDIKLSSDFSIPIASLSAIDTIGVLMLSPLMDKVVYPLLAKYNVHLSKLQRMGIGMVFLTTSVLCAGTVELYRIKHCCVQQHRGHDVNQTLSVSSLSILYQAPQYLLLAMSEVFTVITGLEFAYTEAPKTLQGLIMGIFLLTTGLGTYFGAAVVAVVNAISGASGDSYKWYPDKYHINDGKLANYFFLLAGLMFLNFILYIFVARNFKKSKTKSSYENMSEIGVLTVSFQSKSTDL